MAKAAKIFAPKESFKRVEEMEKIRERRQGREGG